jgi:cysteine-rich repeat protein
MCNEGNDGIYNCTSDCRVPICGDGVVDPPETCEDGKSVDFYGCSAKCRREFCGDNTIQPGEECDSGYASAVSFDDDGNRFDDDDFFITCNN